eukprot:TRINITY_DN4483_c0_g1_i1.p1 TRINITY_DN4483_c0_g1~~TRINITY_DN4483_c0_g1_i1.p1  ORF type:complete len:575 (-),score=68.76 TRINITY_DN4483_c0_g1_i1:1083-2627(-)
MKKMVALLDREQLENILLDASFDHEDILQSVRGIVGKEPSTRKIFVRGLGLETSSDSLRATFSQFGEVEEGMVITDKATGRSRGFGFITFRNVDSCLAALEQPGKTIDGKVTTCQLAAQGPAPPPAVIDEKLQRKVYVGNVPADCERETLAQLFSEYGEIEDGPVGFDRVTKKSKGYCLILYKTVEGARKCLQEANKMIGGQQVYCKLAAEGLRIKHQTTAGRNPGEKDSAEQYHSGARSGPLLNQYMPGGPVPNQHVPGGQYIQQPPLPGQPMPPLQFVGGQNGQGLSPAGLQPMSSGSGGSILGMPMPGQSVSTGASVPQYISYVPAGAPSDGQAPLNFVYAPVMEGGNAPSEPQFRLADGTILGSPPAGYSLEQGSGPRPPPVPHPSQGQPASVEAGQQGSIIMTASGQQYRLAPGVTLNPPVPSHALTPGMSYEAQTVNPQMAPGQYVQTSEGLAMVQQQGTDASGQRTFVVAQPSIGSQPNLIGYTAGSGMPALYQLPSGQVVYMARQG